MNTLLEHSSTKKTNQLETSEDQNWNLKLILNSEYKPRLHNCLGASNKETCSHQWPCDSVAHLVLRLLTQLSVLLAHSLSLSDEIIGLKCCCALLSFFVFLRANVSFGNGKKLGSEETGVMFGSH